MDSKFLQVQNLTKFFESKRISANFELENGKAISLIGPSGCGKSTVLSMIAGLLKADSGSILLDGVDITNLKPFDRNVGMVFQNYALFPHLNVFENIAFGLHSKKLNKLQIKKLVQYWLKKFSLDGFERRAIQDLSGGEKQRIALARTLITHPKLILFDEPLSALDTNLRKQLQVELLETQKKEGYTAVYVTHDFDEANFLADKIFYFEN